MIIVQTPLRVSFLGGGTDYPEHFEKHGGAVLGTAIDKYCYITIAPLTRFADYRMRIAYSKLELPDSVDKIQHPVIRACLEHVGIDGGIEINVISDLPARTGLGSSSTFTVCLLHALYAYRGKYVSAPQLAQDAIFIERGVLKERVGCQDQYLAAVGGFRYVEFESIPAIRPHIVPCRAERLRALEGTLLMFYTGLTRHASEILKEQMQRTKENAEALGQMRELARRGLELVCGDGPIRDFGRLLHDGWVLKQSLSSQISNSTIDGLYTAAMEAGAIGGKLLGAGAGGFILFQVEPERQASVREALAGCPEVRFRFEGGGSRLVFFQQNLAVS